MNPVPMLRLLSLPLVSALVCVAAAPPQGAQPPAAPSPAPAPPATSPTAPPATPPAARAPFATADALLDATEAVAATLKDFSAGVTLETADDVTGDTERRNGQVVFTQQPGQPGTRCFAVVFETFVDGSGRMDKRPVRYLYADGWMTEADFTQRTLIRRQLSYPGEAYDPLRAGEGPVPLPVGQRKADVLRRFEVELVTTPPAGTLAKLKNAQGIQLTPRTGMADRDLVKAVIWYDLQTLAPVAVEAHRKTGRNTVLLRQPAINAGLTDEQRAMLTLAAGATEGWRVDERPLPPKAKP